MVAFIVVVLAFAAAAITAPWTGGKTLTLLLSGETEIITGVVVIFWLTVVHRGGLRLVGFRFDMKDVGVGAAGGIAIHIMALLVIAPILVWVLHSITGSTVNSPRQLPSNLNGVQIALAGFFVVSAAFGEELFFRGLLFRGLRGYMGFAASGVISSLVFGAVHYSGLGSGSYLLMITMFFVGFGFAFVYERRGNILADMTSHAVFNLISFVLLIWTMSH